MPVTPAALEVRTAGPNDFAAVADLTERVYVDGGHADQSYVPTLRDVAGRAASTTVLVALLDGAAVGAVAIATRGGDYAEQSAPGEAVMRMLAVDESARGAGVGRVLVQACIDSARTDGCTMLRLSTQPWMTAAHRLYERSGFVRVPERDWSPEPGVDLLGYELAL